jgi:phage shock protein A
MSVVRHLAVMCSQEDGYIIQNIIHQEGYPMASLLDKVQTLVSANLHYLVDQALKQNSIAVINQYVREVEDNLEDLSEAVATVGGQLKTMKRKLEEYQAKADQLDRDIDLFLQEKREDLAMAAQSKLNSTKRLVETYSGQVDQMQREYQNLMDARLKLEAKLTTIKEEREQLEALLELAKSKEIASRTIKSLDDLAGTGDTDVARIADSIRSRLDRASAETEMRSATLDKQMDDMLDRHEIDGQLAARKARLGLGG